MTITIGVVGAGYIGAMHARAAAHCGEAQLAAVVDFDTNAGNQLANELGTRYLSSVEDALAADLDAYIVAVPDRAHAAPASTLLRAGKPVLVEKPMADTLDGARTIAQAAVDGGSRVMVGQILRFDPRYVRVAEAVRSGSLGEPLHITAGRIARRDVGLRMAGASSVLFYLGVHDVDAMQWVSGQRIVRVYSRAVSKLMRSHGVESEDAIFTVTELADGTIGELFNGWTRHSNDPVGIDGRFEIMGTEGSAAVDVRDHGVRIFDSSGLATPDTLHWPEVNGRVRGDLAAEVRHFASAVATGEPFVVPTVDAMRNVAVNDAIQRSLASDQAADVAAVELSTTLT